MRCPDGDGLESAQGRRLYRRVADDGGSIAELAKVVLTPGPDRAIVLERQAMTITGGDARNPVQLLYLHGRMAVDRGSVAQLACLIGTPAQTVPSLLSARLWRRPAAMAVTRLKLSTW